VELLLDCTKEESGNLDVVATFCVSIHSPKALIYSKTRPVKLGATLDASSMLQMEDLGVRAASTLFEFFRGCCSLRETPNDELQELTV
jgi:hypothetical protein